MNDITVRREKFKFAFYFCLFLFVLTVQTPASTPCWMTTLHSEWYSRTTVCSHYEQCSGLSWTNEVKTCDLFGGSDWPQVMSHFNCVWLRKFKCDREEIETRTQWPTWQSCDNTTGTGNGLRLNFDPWDLQTVQTHNMWLETLLQVKITRYMWSPLNPRSVVLTLKFKTFQRFSWRSNSLFRAVVFKDQKPWTELSRDPLQ